MEFCWGDEIITLTSQIYTIPREVGIISIERIRRKGGQCYLIQIERISDAKLKGDQEQAKELKELVHQFTPLFEEPQDLPPNRKFDHRIVLKDEAKLVNVHPYRYTHFQKEEIERQVREMLDKGLIRPSKSVLLTGVAS